MFFEKTRKSDRFQTLAAVIFMGLFAFLFLLFMVPSGSITGLVCGFTRNLEAFSQMCSGPLSSPEPANSSEFIASRINAACVDTQGLKVSVAFAAPVTGDVQLQVFSTGPDFFPSTRGLTDTYETSTNIAEAADHLDFVIPVESMPDGEQIFGNVTISNQKISSHVAYLVNVSDCSASTAVTPNTVPISIPVISSATCLARQQLMIAFEFEKPLLGQYQASVANKPYQLASVVNQPAMLFFSGEPPPKGPILIRLVSATDESIIFEETYTPPVCGAT